MRFFRAASCFRFIARKDRGRSFSSFSTPEATSSRAAFSREAFFARNPFLPLRGLHVKQTRPIWRNRQACNRINQSPDEDLAGSTYRGEEQTFSVAQVLSGQQISSLNLLPKTKKGSQITAPLDLMASLRRSVRSQPETPWGLLRRRMSRPGLPADS